MLSFDDNGEFIVIYENHGDEKLIGTLRKCRSGYNFHPARKVVLSYKGLIEISGKIKQLDPST